MDRTISDLNRITIAVREWAVETEMRQELGIGANYINIQGVIGSAKKLEEYVLKGIKEEEKLS